MLTATKWTTVGIAVLLIPLMALWIMNGYKTSQRFIHCPLGSPASTPATSRYR
jgi:hypothetical protein